MAEYVSYPLYYPHTEADLNSEAASEYGRRKHILSISRHRCLARHYWYSSSASGYYADDDEGRKVPCETAPAWANGFDFDPDPSSPGDNSSIDTGVLVGKGQVIELTIPGQRYNVSLSYPASDPGGVTWDATENRPKLPSSGNVRLWNVWNSSGRRQATVLSGGDYVPPGSYSETSPGFNSAPGSNSRTVLLYIEGVKPGPATFSLSVQSSFTDNHGTEQQFTTSSEVTINVGPVDNPGPICTPCQCTDEKFTDAAGRVDNGMGTMTHEADDYCYPTPSSSCTSCSGGVTSGVYDKPTMRTRRVHRYDLQEWPSSFGPGVFHGYDLRLRGQASQGKWSLWDPSRQQPLTLTISGNQLVDRVQGSLRDVSFYNASGGSVGPNQDPARAILHEFDGRQVIFEIIPAAVGDAHASLYGRPIRIQDARGQGIDLSYVHNRGAGDAELGGDRGKLWQLDSITDAYGFKATVSYRNGIYGYPVVSEIKYPGGNTASYTYRMDGRLPGLASVQQVDGSVTSIDIQDGSGGEVVVAVRDPMADGFHSEKRITLSTPTSSTSKAWRVKNVSKGSGEQIYRGEETSDDQGHNVTLVQDGDRIFRHITNRGVPIRTDYLKVGTWEGAMSSGAWDKGRVYAFSSQNRISSIEDALGKQTRIQPDSMTGYPTRVDYPDDSYETWLYDGDGNAIEHRDRLGQITHTAYNARHQKLTERSPDGAQRSWTYDATTGALLTVTDPLGRVTSHGYDDVGRLVSVSEPGNQPGDADVSKTFGYDGLNRLVWSKDHLGNQTSYSYDARGRLLRTTYGDATYEENTYGTGVDAGRVILRRDRNGYLTDIVYDAAGRLASQATRVQHLDGQLEMVGDQMKYISGTQLVQSRRIRGETTVSMYDQQRRLVSETAYASRDHSLTTTHVYDVAGRRVSTMDPFGRRTYFVYDEADRIVRTVRESLPGAVSLDANIPELARDADSNPRWVIEESVYDAGGRLTTRIDGRGVESSFTYDGDGRVLSRTDGGATTSFTYDAVGNQLTITTPRGAVIRNTYNRANLLWVKTEAFGSLDETVANIMLYTKTRKPLTQIDARGGVTTYVYGGCCDRLRQVEDAVGFITEFGYDSVGNRTSVTDPNQLTTTTMYDALHRPVSVQNAAGEITRYRYDDNLLDGVGLDATYAAYMNDIGMGYDPVTGYGADGSAVAITNSADETVLEIRDGVGRLLKQLDPLGHAIVYRYDEVVTDVRVDSDGSMVSDQLVATTATDAEQHSTSQWVDGLGRVRVQVDAMLQKSHLSFDAVGNQVAQLDPNGVGWTATYSPRGFLLSRNDTRALRSTRTDWTYDADGNRTSETIYIDGVAKTETYTYDLRNRRKTLTDRLQGVTTFDYDAVGNLLQITDAQGGITTYRYDDRNLLIEETFPGPTGGKRTYTYDPGRRLKTRTQQPAVVGGN